VEWRVKDRFRLFERASYEARARTQRLADHILAAGPSAGFDESFYYRYLRVISGRDASRVHSASLRLSNYQPAGDEAQRTSGRYAEDYLYPEHYSVEFRVRGVDPAAVCAYASALQEARGRCGAWTGLAVAEGPAASRNGWRVQAAVRVNVPGWRQQRAAIDFTDELVVALGDSYISGEGNPDAPSLINDRPDAIFERPSWGARAALNNHILREAEWWDEPCHRSLLSWPVIASFVHSARNQHKAVTFVHLGCSGAVARDIYSQGEIELPGGGNERESQLALLDRLMQRPGPDWARRRVDTTFLSVGGNDIGFVGVLATIMLPPNGFTLGGLIARTVGERAGAVCPYDDSGNPLRRLCRTQESAERRLVSLQREYRRLERALGRAGINDRIFQPVYPNPLIGARNLPCDTNPNNDRDRSERVSRPASGFEALMGFLPREARGFRFRSWNFELQYYPERDTDADNRERRLYPDLPIDCDWVPDPDDSEICQALWVHARLNQEVNRSPWRAQVFDGHYSVIAGNGLCNHSDRFPLSLPVIAHNRWVGGRTPQAYDPYDYDAVRWFRVPNDSILTQFGFHAGEARFHHGTVHPTFRAHLAVAAAAYERAFRTASPGPQPSWISAGR
jgi:hypothetical protein